jgi:hypothetical protein
VYRTGLTKSLSRAYQERAYQERAYQERAYQERAYQEPIKSLSRAYQEPEGLSVMCNSTVIAPTIHTNQ